MTDDLLGAYLRARRARVRPDDVDLPSSGQRRVPGLRREEVALLAGISGDYYLRLEQGRGGRPSEQVLRALARALQLDAPATDHLLGFIAPGPAAAAQVGEQPPSSVLNLLEVLNLPAFVTGRTFDVLAANTAARALSPELQPGRNRLRSVFLVAAERALPRLGGDHTALRRHGVRDRRPGCRRPDLRAAARRAHRAQPAVPAAVGPL